MLRGRRRELEQAARRRPAARAFEAALRVSGAVAIVAEFKRRSPSAGAIRAGARAGAVVGAYEAAGASAVSVLTDAAFDGSLEDLAEARAATALPLLRKDFVLDPLQVVEARASGADAVLLIVRALAPSELGACLGAASEWGCAALVEVHDERELGAALEAGARVVGVNNRDLATFETDLGVTERLAARVPPEVVLVSESGYRGLEDVRWAGELGVDAVLVGERMMSEAEPGRAVAGWVGLPKRPRDRGA